MGVYYTILIIVRNPENPILIIKASTLVSDSVAMESLQDVHIRNPKADTEFGDRTFAKQESSELYINCEHQGPNISQEAPPTVAKACVQKHAGETHESGPKNTNWCVASAGLVQGGVDHHCCDLAADEIPVWACRCEDEGLGMRASRV